MKISDNIYQIRIDFDVLPSVKRYVYVYIIAGKDGCYLIDSGVDNSEKFIINELHSIGKATEDIKAILLTHSHPDHIGGASELKRLSGCNVFASVKEQNWIEDIEKEFAERPIPNFHTLLNKSTKVDCPIDGNKTIKLEDEITIKAIETPGHSKGSISYLYIEKNILFSGDAIPTENDIPIYTNLRDSISSVNIIKDLSANIVCPAWDKTYSGTEINDKCQVAVNLLNKISECAKEIKNNNPQFDNNMIFEAVCKELNMNQFAINPLFKTSVLSSL